MPGLPKQSFDALALSEKRRLYEVAFSRGRRIMDVPRAEWIQPDPGDWVLPEVLADCQRRMAGCSRDEAEEVLALVVTMMRCEPPSDLLRAGYLTIMTMFPKELLLPSVRLAVAAERYHVLPTVGALCHSAQGEQTIRSNKVALLKTAISRLELRQFYEDKAGDRSRAARLRGSQPRSEPRT